jgi:hypothetical protein
VQNVLIESALVNARVLAYFLSKRPGKEVVAGDFVVSWQPRTDLGRLIGLISDHLAHAKHIVPPGRWELGQIARSLIDGLRDFVNELRNHDPTRAAWFEESVEPAYEMLTQMLPE